MEKKKVELVETYIVCDRKVNRWRCECGKTFSVRSYLGKPEKYCETCWYGEGRRIKKESSNSPYTTTKNKKLLSIWTGMKSRCNNPNSRGYRWYGANGIKVCDEWKHFSNFCQWALSHGYKEGLSIERIDVSKGYCPDNCTWIPLKEQPKNRRDTYNNKKITIDGETKTYKEWAEFANISPQELGTRISRGISPHKIVYGKKEHYHKTISINGITKSLQEWLNDAGISRQAYHNRLKYGWSEEEALTTPKSKNIK